MWLSHIHSREFHPRTIHSRVKCLLQYEKPLKFVVDFSQDRHSAHIYSFFHLLHWCLWICSLSMYIVHAILRYLVHLHISTTFYSFAAFFCSTFMLTYGKFSLWKNLGEKLFFPFLYLRAGITKRFPLRE